MVDAKTSLAAAFSRGFVTVIVTALSFGCVGVFFGETLFGLIIGSIAGATFGFPRAVLGALRESAFNYHVALKLTMLRAGLLPWKLVSFLEDLVTAELMYRAGPAYRFKHRSLVDWLADGDWMVDNDPNI